MLKIMHTQFFHENILNKVEIGILCRFAVGWEMGIRYHAFFLPPCN